MRTESHLTGSLVESEAVYAIFASSLWTKRQIILSDVMETTHKIWVVDVMHLGPHAGNRENTRHIFTSRAAAVEFMAHVRIGTPRLGTCEIELPAEIDWPAPLYSS